VDVRLDQRRRDQRAAEVDGLLGVRLELADQPVLDADVARLRLSRQTSPAKEQIEHSTES
jgi:hypothetical protein